MKIVNIISYLCKATLIVILLAPSCLISCSLSASVEMKSGNVHEIFADINLDKNMLEFKCKLTPLPNSLNIRVLTFYIPSKHHLDNLKITNEHGSKLKYKIDKIDNLSMVEVEIGDNNQSIALEYDLDLLKMKSSIAYFRGDNQFFILPEASVLPRNNAEIVPDNIHYVVNVSESAKEYEYVKETSLTNVHSMPPPIIFGNFKQVKYGNIQAYIPIDNTTDEVSLDAVMSHISDSYNYYTASFGQNEYQNVEVFFLNRRGGYTIPNGIILDQKYISENNRTSIEEVVHIIAHEIAHLWWGIGVSASSWSITEGLAELSCDFYLANRKKQDSKDIYSRKNSIVLDSDIKPKNFGNLSLSDANYKTFAYNKLPIILHEAELKMGSDNAIKALRDFYLTEKNSSKPQSLESIFKFFPPNHQIEIIKDLDGTLEDWPDFYVKEVTNNTVTFGSQNVYFPEIVPVKLTTDGNEIIQDTLHFDSGLNEIVKQYSDDIVKIIIDSNFNTNQSILLNDLWIKKPKSLLNNKWQHSCDAKYDTFFNALLGYVFTDEVLSITEIADEKNISLLSKAKNALKEVAICNTYLRLREQNHSFKLTLAVKSQKGFETGYIEGYFYESKGHLRLKAIKRIKI